MPAYLQTIVAAHRAHAGNDRRDLGSALEEAGKIGGVRSFVDAIRKESTHTGMAVIAEIKRRSPSKGDLDLELDPGVMAADYAAGGAACLSVLTDQDFFGGNPDDLRSARSACDLPVLRKDFTVSGLDVCDARAMGADAVLLIVAALSDEELTTFLDIARQLGLTALVEIHDEPELQRALDVGAEVVGVNQRDLRTFEVDHQRALKLGAMIPGDVMAVAESGIRDSGDVRRLREAGYQAVLVGEALVRSGDRRTAVQELLGSAP